MGLLDTCSLDGYFGGGYPLAMTNIAMEHGPFIVDFPIETSMYEGFSMAMLVITRGYINS